MPTPTRRLPLVAALAAAGLVGCGVAAAPEAPAATQAPSVHSAPTSPGLVPDYPAIVRADAPAVVGVSVRGAREPPAWPQTPNDPFFRFFRGLPGFGMAPPSGEMPFRGLGSGFIITSDGLILTNAHVVRDAKEVSVRLADRREYRAKVVGVDAVTDVAVLRIDATGLPVVRMGDPHCLQVGDPVLAIGSPFGFDESATQGIVSAKGRSLPGDDAVPFIQTDAAVNPGNSGGPLIDGSGAVVGINAQIYSRSGGYQGLAFAIPIDVAIHAKDQIVATGHATHARLGVSVQDLSQGLADSFGLAAPDGALVASVDPGSAAAAAGLKAGDVITAVDGEAIERAGDLSARVGLATPGDKVALVVWRDRAQRKVEATLGTAHADDEALAQGGGLPSRVGLELRPLTHDEKERAHTDHGLEVERAGGLAAGAGLQRGDVLLELDGQPLHSVAQARKLFVSHPRHVALLVDRDGERIYLSLALG